MISRWELWDFGGNWPKNDRRPLSGKLFSFSVHILRII